MKIAIAFLLIVAAGAQTTETVEVAPTPGPFDLTIELLTALINSEFFQNKLQRFYQVLDLKLQFFKLVGVLLKPENLMTFRQILEYVVSVCNVIISYLPKPNPEQSGGFVETLFPLIGLGTPQTPQTPEQVQRVDRDVHFSKEEQELFEKHKNDVNDLAKLIYKTP